MSVEVDVRDLRTGKVETRTVTLSVKEIWRRTEGKRAREGTV